MVNTTTLGATTSAFGRRHLNALVGAFVFGWALIAASGYLINPLLPLVRAEFRLSGAETGLLTAAFTLPYLVMQIPAGMLADRLGPKRIMVVMATLAGLATTAMGLWSYGLPALITFTALQAIGNGVYYPTVFGVTARAVPARVRGTVSGLLVMGMALGSAAALGLAVPVAALAANNWRFPLLLCGLLMLLMPPLFLLLRWPAAGESKVSIGRMVQAVSDRALLPLFAINLFSSYAFTVVVVWGPSFLSGERGLSLATAGFYIALINLIGFPAGLASSVLSDRIGRRLIVLLLFVAAAIAVAALGIFNHAALTLAAVVCFGLAGKWSSDGVLMAWMGDHVAARFGGVANAVYGVNNTARMVGMLLAPLASGALMDRTGTLAPGFFVAAAVLFVAAGLAPLVAEHR